MKVWVERHPKMKNLHRCHYHLKMLFEKIFLKDRSLGSIGPPSPPPSPQRVNTSLIFLIYLFIATDL